METFVGALGTVVAVFVMMRMERVEFRSEFRDLRTEVKDLRTEMHGIRDELRGEIRATRVELGAKIDAVATELLHHVQQGHPPHHAA